MEPSQGPPNQMKQTLRRNTPAQVTLRENLSNSAIPQLGQAPHDLRKPKRQLIGIVLSHAGQIGLSECMVAVNAERCCAGQVASNKTDHGLPASAAATGYARLS